MIKTAHITRGISNLSNYDLYIRTCVFDNIYIDSTMGLFQEAAII